MIGKIRTAIIACMAAAIWITASCAAFAEAKANIVVWFPSSGNTDSTTRTAFNAYFEKKYPQAKIVETPQPNDNWDELFKAANLAGNGPDVVCLWPGAPTTDYAPFLLPLNAYLDDATMASLSGWELARVGFKTTGPVYGIPTNGYIYCIWYNKQLLAKVGVTDKNPPRSWNEFLAVCGKLKAQGIVPFVLGTRDGYIVQWGVGCLVTSLMGKEGASRVIDPSYAFVGSEVQKATELWQELGKRGYLNKDASSLSTGDEQDRVFTTGGGAMLLSGNWEYKSLGSAMKDNLGFFAFPAVDPNGPNKDCIYAGPGYNICVTKYSRHVNEAVAYAKEFTTNPDRVIGQAQETGDLPLIKGFDASQIKDPLIRQYAQILGRSQATVILDLIPLNAFNEFVRMGGALTLGKMSAKDAMVLMDKEIGKLKSK
jgi:ABC-type glycerol-3-phosphate transport system substrate-binding protein